MGRFSRVSKADKPHPCHPGPPGSERGSDPPTRREQTQPLDHVGNPGGRFGHNPDATRLVSFQEEGVLQDGGAAPLPLKEILPPPKSSGKSNSCASLRRRLGISA